MSDSYIPDSVKAKKQGYPGNLDLHKDNKGNVN